MIYVHPIGGIGNMFFHISSIYSLAKDNNDELCLLNIDDKIKNLINDTRGDVKHAEIFRYFFNRFPNKSNILVNKIEYPNSYKQLEYKNEHEYVGYFQSENYFKHHREELLELFKPSDEFLNKINSYSHLFENISLHVRRNDYVTRYPTIHIPQSIEYYNEALKLLPNDMSVVIFSDDLKWCKENFIGDRFYFIDEKDYISIYLMTKMKHFIIANSSFSWWGAWMSLNNNKIIIAPKKWFGGNLLNQDIKMELIPNTWIRL